jgi:hypothetical protein
MLRVVGHEPVNEDVERRSLLDEIAREGARRMLRIHLASIATERAKTLVPPGWHLASTWMILMDLDRAVRGRKGAVPWMLRGTNRE